MVLVAIVPLAIASWAVVRLVSHNQLNTTDANLRAVARVARADYASQLSHVSANATKLAVWPEVQRAVLRHDLAYLRAFQRAHPHAGFVVAGKTLPPVYTGPGEAQSVRVGNTTSTVSLVLPLNAKVLSRMIDAAGLTSSKMRLELLYAGRVVAGTFRHAQLAIPSEADYVVVDGRDYRVVGLNISGTVPAAVAAVQPRATIDTTSGSNWWRAFWAALVTLVTVALLAYLVAPLVAGKRWVRRLRPRELEEQYAVEADIAQEPIAAPVASHGTAPRNGRAAERRAETAVPGVRRRVVVIDDDPDERALIADALGGDSVDVATTGDAEQGLALLGEQPADMTILDWKMSGRSGAEILAELNIRHPDVPVLLVSDELEPQQRHVATLLGAEDFLTRPLDSATVGAKIRRLLERVGTGAAAG